MGAAAVSFRQNSAPMACFIVNRLMVDQLCTMEACACNTAVSAASFCRVRAWAALDAPQAVETGRAASDSRTVGRTAAMSCHPIISPLDVQRRRDMCEDVAQLGVDTTLQFAKGGRQATVQIDALCKP